MDQSNNKLDDAKMNITLHYPYNDKYDYQTRLERIDMDKAKDDNIRNGKGFIISAPKGIKKDIKNQVGMDLILFQM